MVSFKQLQNVICEVSRAYPQFFTKKVTAAKVTPLATFSGDLMLDSLEIVEVFMKIEETFDVAIPDEDVQKLVTEGVVQDLLDYINGNRVFVDSIKPILV